VSELPHEARWPISSGTLGNTEVMCYEHKVGHRRHLGDRAQVARQVPLVRAGQHLEVISTTDAVAALVELLHSVSRP
jgi:hypothetical protein